MRIKFIHLQLFSSFLLVLLNSYGVQANFASFRDNVFDDKQEELKANDRLSRKMFGGEQHSYSVKIKRDQFLQVAVEQKGEDLAIELYSPQGFLLRKFDGFTGGWGTEKLSWIAETEGNYIFKVLQNNPITNFVEYEIYVKELRDKIQKDEKFLEAEKLFIEAGESKAKKDEISLGKAVESFSKSMLVYSGLEDTFMVAQINSCIGSIYSELSQYERSLSWHEKALVGYQQAGYLEGVGTELSNLGTLCGLLNNQDKSIFYSRQALEIYIKLQDKKSQIILKNNIAYAYDLLVKKNDALKYYLECLEEIDSTDLLDLKATILTNIGVLYSDLGDTTNALISHNKALKIYSEKGLKRGKAITLSNIGIIYDNLGQLSEALNKYDEAIFLFDSIGAKVGKAKAETNKGVVLVQLKREQEAKHLYSLALEEFKKSNNKTGQGSVLTKIGELHLQLNEYDKAIATLTEALILRQSLKDRYGEAQNLLLLGKANFVVGNKKTALEQYEESFFINREINYKKGQIRSLYEIAYLHKNQGNIDESLKTIQACINLIESARSDIAVQDLRLSYLASKQECYELCIDVLVTLHEKFPTQDYAKQALIFSERFRARNFLELLTKSTDENNIAYKSLVENVGKYDELLSDKIEQILKIKGISKEEHKLAALQDEIVKIKSDRGIVELEIKKQYPQHYNLERTKFLTFDQIKAAVTDEETLFVEYFLGKETSFCWVVGKDSFQVFRLPSEKIIDPLLDKVIESLKARGEYEKFEFKDEREKRIEALDKQYYQTSIELTNLILSPIASLFDKKKIVVASDGKLNYVPLSVLPFPFKEISAKNFSPLMMHFEVVNIPSATSLSVIRETFKSRSEIAKSIAIFADPVFSQNDPRCKNVSETKLSKAEEYRFEQISEAKYILRDVNLVRLPATRKEGEGILTFFGSNDEKFLAFDFSASLSSVDTTLSKYKYIHFATHNFFSNEQPENSGVLLSLVNREGVSVKGLLSVNRISRLNLSAELVVLSACQTGAGKFSKGEGLLGLTQAFMQAGAKRTLVTLWNVDDSVTAKFMINFYEKMIKRGFSPAKALRETQKEFWENHLAPYYWAAFTLQGENR